MNNRNIGTFFTIDDRKYVTILDYRSRIRFEKLINNYTTNVRICEPFNGEYFKFIPIEAILSAAHNYLENKRRANKLIYSIMAQNDITNING